MELYDLLGEYPHLTYRSFANGARFSFRGYALDVACRNQGDFLESERTGHVYPDTKLALRNISKSADLDYLTEIVPWEGWLSGY